jgi:plasmid stabilization system protein ParE
LSGHPLAEADLEGIVSYIAADDIRAAYRVHDEIANQTAVVRDGGQENTPCAQPTT